jgi:hypothetical protein
VGVSTLQIACDDQRILQFGLDIVNQTLSRGIFEVEVLAEGESLHAIDLNPRAFGFLELDIARGADLPWLWFGSTLSDRMPLPQAVPGVHFQARHWVMHVMNAVARAKIPLGARGSEPGGSSTPRVSVSMLGHPSDPLPMIVSNLLLLRHPRSLMRAQFASSRAEPDQKV